MGVKRRKIFGETITRNDGGGGDDQKAARKLRLVISPTRRYANFLLLSTAVTVFLCLFPVALSQPRPPPPRGPHPPPPSRDVPLRLTPHKLRLHDTPRFARESAPPGSKRGPSPPRNFNPFPRRNSDGPRDLATAAQTLYDLRGYNIPLGGQQETSRFLRENDPFTFSRFQPRTNVDTRTAPLVFPSFYQQQQQETTSKRPQQHPVLNIFGHSQHLSQTKYEPAGGSASSTGNGNNNINNNILQGQPQTFRPSQIDVGFSRHQHDNDIRDDLQTNYRAALQYEHPEPNQLQGRQVPQAQAQTQNFGQNHQSKQILNYRAPGLESQNQVQNNNNQDNNNQQNQQNNNGGSSEEPFIYVYDDEDYDEGEDEFVDKPQQQINTNRVTTPAPRSQVIFPNNNQQQLPSAKPLIQTTPTPTPISHHHHQQQQPDLYSSQVHQPQSQRPDPFAHFNQFPPKFTPTITPTPNVEIVPSSERKPPPDQSNAVTPITKATNRFVNDDRFRRPQTTTSQNNYQQPQIQQQYFTQNNNNQQTQRQPAFNQVVNLEEEEEQVYEQDPEIIQKLNGFPNYEEPSPENKLRPVNTLVPKNRVPLEEFVLPPNFPFHEDIPVTRVPLRSTTETSNNNEVNSQHSNRGDITRQNYRPPQQQQQQQEVSPAPQPPQQHRLRPTPSASPPPPPPPTRTRPTPTRTTTPTATQDIDSDPPKRVRNRPLRPTPPANKIHTFPPFPTTRRPTTPTTTTTTTTFRTTAVPRTTTTTTTTESYEADSDEYYEDDYSEDSAAPNSFERPVSKPQQVKPTANKSPLRPDFNNNKNRNQIQIQELHSPKIEELPRPVPQPPPRRVARPQQQVTYSSTTPGSRYQQSSLSPTAGPNKRFREQSTIESPPAAFVSKKTTTGKPLYYAGKMLSKEGGLYAGQTIPLHHVYGKPVPNVPINSVFDRMPSVLDGHVTRARVTTQATPQVVSPSHVGQQHNRIRVRDRGLESVVSSSPNSARTTSTTTHKNTRLIHPSRIRPITSHQAPPPAPPTEREPEREAVRPRPNKPRPRTTTTTTTPTPEIFEEKEEENLSVPINPPPPPRRRKLRPGQKKLRQQLLQKQEQSVSISHSIRENEDENEDEVDRPEPPRKNLRPNLHRPVRPQPQSVTSAPIVQVLQSQSVSSTESSSPFATAKQVRPRRPRPQQQVQVLQSTSERSEVDQQDQEEDVVPPPPPPPPPQPRPQKRIRPRPQKLQPKLQSEFSEVISKSVSTQASSKVGRKPTEAPNRFSSRFRDAESPPSVSTSTYSSVSESDDDDEPQEQQSPPPPGLKHFSPPPKSKPRPSFKPPVKPASRPTAAPLQGLKPNNKRIKPVQKPQSQPIGESDDDLPPSIRLSAKDVVLNRKPARRIPPGSASDRLKALAERRKKIATPQSYRESLKDEEDDEENNKGQDENNNKGHRTLRRRKLLNNGNGANVNRNEENEEEILPPKFKKPLQQQQQRRIVKKQRIVRPKPVVVQEAEDDDEEQAESRQEIEHDVDDEEKQPEFQQQNKREIKHSSPLQKNRPQSEDVTDDEDKEYDAAPLREHQRPRKLSQRAYERVPAEVTSDEARSVLGIVINQKEEDKPAPHQQYVDEDDYEGHPSHHSEQKISTEPSSTTQTSSSTASYDDDGDDEYSGDKQVAIVSSSTTSTSSSSSTEAPEPSSTTSASSSTTSSPTEASTTAAYLKARLRPNKKLLASLQPKLSSAQQRDKNESTRSTNLSKLLKFRTSASTYSPISSFNTKIFTMATEDPSLPLEDMFSNVNKS
ncbi:titin isoform X2 [Folsomia candida]|uniref:titin isoform X2 n=1 Tax=Folsomia candida TaxID=158441 RepID=UPI001604AA45|nr:titin isoform X2 [Folsomia candida]